ncbi:MAG: ABC transporter ATP-binding protein [Bacteroidota bacterium]
MSIKPSVVEVRKLSLSLGGHLILNNVSLTVPAGLVYVIGLNGSGKTSLLHCISNTRKFQDGSIHLLGKDLKTLSPRQISHILALVPQRPTISFHLTTYNYVLSGRFPFISWLGNYKKSDHAQVSQTLDKLELLGFKDRYLHELSGGEFQQIAIARAMVQETPIIVLDEPTQSLDPKNRKKIYRLLNELVEKGKTIICSTHDGEPLREEKRQIIGLSNGEIAFQGAGSVSKSEIDRLVYQM